MMGNKLVGLPTPVIPPSVITGLAGVGKFPGCALDTSNGVEALES